MEILEAVETPGTDHEESGSYQKSQPHRCQPPGLDGLSLEKVDGGSYHRSAGRNRHANKIFFPGTPGVRGLRGDLNVESSQAACAAHLKVEPGPPSHPTQLFSPLLLRLT